MDGTGANVGLVERQAEAGDAPPKPEVPVGPDAPIMAVMRTTRAMRHLAPDPVPDELIRTVIEAATWAPSGGNWQPANYVVVTDRAKMAELAVLWGRAIDDFMLTTEAAGIRTAPDQTHQKTAASIAYQRQHFAETPALIVICEDSRAIGMTRGKAGMILALIRRAGLRRALHILRASPNSAAAKRRPSIRPRRTCSSPPGPMGWRPASPPGISLPRTSSSASSVSRRRSEPGA